MWNGFENRTRMKSKIKVVLLLLLYSTSGAFCSWAAGLTSFNADLSTLQRLSTDDFQKKEITIRNVTNVTVHYTVKLINSDAEPLRKTLHAGAIDRLQGDESMEIFFQRNEQTINYMLDPDSSYSFRYDEEDRLELYLGSHGRADAVDLAPFVASPKVVVERMLEMAQLDEKDILFDLGCGDGRIVITAAKKYGTQGVGIDIVPERIEESNEAARKAGVEHLVEFRLQDVTKADFSQATVVTLYLIPQSNELIQPLLEKQLRPGTYVISHNYSIPGWEMKEVSRDSVATKDGNTHTIYLYKK